jgi:PKD repeat protein
VTLTVTDAAGDSTAVTDQVTAQNVPPTASFSVSNTAPARGQLIGFDATATDPDGDTLSYAWDLGDGTTASGQNVTHAPTPPIRA